MEFADPYPGPHPGVDPEDNPIMVVVREGEDPTGPPRHGDSVFDQYVPVPAKTATGPDGLPMQVWPDLGPYDAMPPALAPETLTCMKQPASEALPEGLAKCVHYRRQITREPLAIDRPIIERWCVHTAQRGLNGAAMSLRDTEVPACELRDPVDPRCEQLLDHADAVKVQLGKERDIFPMFKTVEDLAAKRTHVGENDARIEHEKR
jgi:hypothetical protein